MALSQLVAKAEKLQALKKSVAVITKLFYLPLAASFVHKIPKKE